ncbi:MAG TPA: WbqC family protein [Rubricoccaceae bacterium]
MLAVRPPDYFPPAAHAALLATADRVVLADTFAFSRQATHNRARILTSQGAQWITVPRTHAPVGTPLRGVEVVPDGWPRRHLRSLRAAYGMAPFTEALLPEIAALLAVPHPSIGALGAATTAWTVRRLGGPAEVGLASDMPGAPATLAAVWEAAGRPVLLSLTPERDRAALAGLGATVEAFRFDEAPRRQVWPPPPGAALTPSLSALDVVLTYGAGAREALLGSGA